MDTSKLLHIYNQKLRLHQAKLNTVLQPYGLFHSQWSILYTIFEKGNMTQTEIWQYLRVEAPTVTRTLVRMEKSGWIERKVGKDKRERVVTLTEKARTTYPEILRVVKETEAWFLADLSVEERETLQQLLEKLSTEKR